MIYIVETQLTKQLKHQIYRATHKMGAFGCFEVTIGLRPKDRPGKNMERVDYITYDTKGIVRCFELKVSVSDFHSGSAVTFIGDYNYYVLTKDVYDKVKDEISKDIGVYVYEGNNPEFGYATCVKNAKKQIPLVSKEIILESMVRSMSRDVHKTYQSNDEFLIDQYKRNLDNAEKSYRKEVNKNSDIINKSIEIYGIEWYHKIIRGIENIEK